MSCEQWTVNIHRVEPENPSPSECSTVLVAAEPEDPSPSKHNAILMKYPTQFGFDTKVRGAAQFYTWFGFHLSPGDSSRKRQRSMSEVDSGRPKKRARIFIDDATESFIVRDRAISEQPYYLDGLHLGEALYRDAHQ